ncbi:hypothetical protein NC651_036322 [Populus alba x Populus x berolinensis]|nr:hypothetical protein NC651_036322 [Populus alba x Populus x berolinensis]
MCSENDDLPPYLDICNLGVFAFILLFPAPYLGVFALFASLCDRENGERLRDSIVDLLKFTLESHVNQTLEFNPGLSKEFCIDLLEEDPNDMSCHVTVRQRMEAKQSKEGVLLLIFSLFCYRIGLGDVILVNKTMNAHRYASFLKMLQAESLEKVLPGVKTVEEEEKEVSNGVLAICVSKLAAQPYLSLASILFGLNNGGVQSQLGTAGTGGTVSNALPLPRSTLL